MSASKKTSGKSPQKADLVLIDELRCMVLFQGYNADVQTTEQFAAPDSILMNNTDMRQCNLRSGSYVHLKVDADLEDEVGQEAYLLLRVWPSKTLGNKMVTINRTWWPNFTAKAKEERIGLINTRFKDIRVLPCHKLRVLVMSNEQDLSNDVLHSSTFIEHVRAYIFEIPLLNRQMMGVLYRGRAIVIQFIRIQGDASFSTDDGSSENSRLTCAYKVTSDTFISITTTDENENEGAGISSNKEQTSRALVFGGYTEQLEYANNILRLTLGLHAMNTPIQEALSHHADKNTDNMLPQLFTLPKGLLIHGPRGSGKTLLMHTLLHQNGNKISHVELSHDILLLPYVGDAEKAVLSCFEEARKKAPCVILIDDIDILCRSRTSNTATTVQKSIVSSLLTIIDGVIDSTSTNLQVFIMATSSKPQDIDAAMRRPGRLDVEVELTAPTAQQREGILDSILNVMQSNSNSTKLTREGIRKVAQDSHGFVGSDLLQVIKEAHVISSDRVLSNDNGKDVTNLLSSAARSLSLNGDTASCVDISDTDLLRALSKVPPSALREVVAEIPSVKWSDVGGMHIVKSSLQEVVEWPLKYADLFSELQLPPPQGVLLYGPPGCSKTLMAKALATESSMNFLAVRGPELLSKWLGESEKAVQLLFKRARAAAPSIVFFDEIDALAGKRGTSNMGVNDRVLAQLLTELDGIASKSHSSNTMTAKRVIVVAATNRPDMLDDALLRPGRIDRKVFVPPPDAESRQQIFSIELNKLPVQKGVDKLIPSLVINSEGFSGAEVVAICKEAAMFAMEAGDQEVKHDYLSKALKATKPQITKEMLHFYNSLTFHK